MLEKESSSYMEESLEQTEFLTSQISNRQNRIKNISNLNKSFNEDESENNTKRTELQNNSVNDEKDLSEIDGIPIAKEVQRKLKKMPPSFKSTGRVKDVDSTRLNLKKDSRLRFKVTRGSTNDG